MREFEGLTIRFFGLETLASLLFSNEISRFSFQASSKHFSLYEIIVWLLFFYLFLSLSSYFDFQFWYLKNLKHKLNFELVKKQKTDVQL